MNKHRIMMKMLRDILVSSYYSIGYTHGLSKVKEIREGQMETRNVV